MCYSGRSSCVSGTPRDPPYSSASALPIATDMPKGFSSEDDKGLLCRTEAPPDQAIGLTPLGDRLGPDLLKELNESPCAGLSSVHLSKAPEKR